MLSHCPFVPLADHILPILGVRLYLRLGKRNHCQLLGRECLGLVMGMGRTRLARLGKRQQPSGLGWLPDGRLLAEVLQTV